MASIEIKNIGPIKDSGKIELNQFNVFIGPQSSGKSTLMKIISYCSWIEKQVGLDLNNIKYYSTYSRFIKKLKAFHKFDDSFFNKHSSLHFNGEYIDIIWPKKSGAKNPVISKKPNAVFYNKKMSYIPAERNLVFAVKNVDKVYFSQEWDNLFNYVNEWGIIEKKYSPEEAVNIPFLNNIEFYYDEKKKKEVIRLGQTGEIEPYYASSGIQSVLPVMVIMEYLTETIYHEKIRVSADMIKRLNSIVQYIISDVETGKVKQSEILKNILLNENGNLKDDIFEKNINDKYGYKSSNVFIEEPEQNLFPDAQRSFIEDMVQKVNRSSSRVGRRESMLNITTHSPYIITTLNSLILANDALNKDKEKTIRVLGDINKAVPFEKINAYYVGNGIVESIMNTDLRMIAGDKLDSASDIVSEFQDKLDDIVYGENE